MGTHYKRLAKAALMSTTINAFVNSDVETLQQEQELS